MDRISYKTMAVEKHFASANVQASDQRSIRNVGVHPNEHPRGAEELTACAPHSHTLPACRRRLTSTRSRGMRQHAVSVVRPPKTISAQPEAQRCRGQGTIIATMCVHRSMFICSEENGEECVMSTCTFLALMIKSDLFGRENGDSTVQSAISLATRKRCL